MMLAGFLLLLLFTDAASEDINGDFSEPGCSYQDVINYLNLTQNKELFSMTRPVKNYTEPTRVYLDVLLYAILDVREKEQEFVPYVWIVMVWRNKYISWNPEEFCGITNISLPTELFWKPDVTILEMIEKDRTPTSPYLLVCNDGITYFANHGVLVCTCRMHVYQFPFDVQSCRLSFKSIVHSHGEIEFVHHLDSEKVTEGTLELMQTQYEWLFINMTVKKENVNNFGFVQSQMVYTITMKRRSALYIINFMLPVMFFLGLDMATVLISDSGGEKLGFQVTVLLAVTVLQLLLNEILPATSNRIPLIAIYCIGIFGLMMLSLLETIVVMYLIDKDSASQDNRTDEDNSLRGDGCRLINCVSDMSPAEPTPELLSATKEGSSSQLMKEGNDTEKLLAELMEVMKTLAVLLNSRKEDMKPGYWIQKTKIINKVFFISYVTAVILFLIYMFSCWTADDYPHRTEQYSMIQNAAKPWT